MPNLRQAENFGITVPLVQDRVGVFLPTCLRFSEVVFFFKICHHDFAVTVKKRSPENFGLRTKRPLAFFDESKVQLIHALELSTGLIIGIANSFGYHEKANKTFETTKAPLRLPNR